MDIVNNQPKTEEKPQEHLQSELQAARIKELEELLAKSQKDNREWSEILDLRVEQTVETKLAEAEAQRAAEAAAEAEAAAIDRRPRVVGRPNSYQEYMALPLADRSRAISKWGQSYIEELAAKDFTEKRRRRDFGGGGVR